MGLLLVRLLVGVLSVGVVAGGAALAVNYKAVSDLAAASVDRYTTGQGGWVSGDVWGRSATAVRWYGAGIAMVGVFGLGIALYWTILVVAACAGLAIAVLGATLSGFRYKVQTAPLLNAPPRMWEIIGWSLVLMVLFVVGGTAEVVIYNVPR